MRVTAPTPTNEVLVRRSGGLGRLTLNRPVVLNALTPGMVARMSDAIAAWEGDDAIGAILIDGAGERGFCAGGDVRILHASGRRRDGLAQRFWHDEYVLDAYRPLRPSGGRGHVGHRHRGRPRPHRARAAPDRHAEPAPVDARSRDRPDPGRRRDVAPVPRAR